MKKTIKLKNNKNLAKKNKNPYTNNEYTSQVNDNLWTEQCFIDDTTLSNFKENYG